MPEAISRSSLLFALLVWLPLLACTHKPPMQTATTATAIASLTAISPRTPEASPPPPSPEEVEAAAMLGEAPVLEAPSPERDFAASAAMDVAQSDAPAAPPPSLPFARFMASSCLIDQLARTEYAEGWEGWFREPDFVPEGAPLPAPPEAQKAMRPEAIEALTQQINRTWTANPESHIADCTYVIPARECPGCAGRGSSSINYIVWLPPEASEDPGSVTSILLVVPGGNGGRTRYFLTPVPGTNIYKKKSGGLETKRRADDFREARPGEVAPIIVALDSGGFLSANGSTEFLTYDIPMHIAKTYLGRDNLEGIKLGVEGISSGARVMMDALRAKPDAFDTFGVIAMHCGGRNGITVKDLGSTEEREAWLKVLKARVDAGELHFRFSVGNRDPGWRCHMEFYDMFVKAGIFPKSEPVYECDASIKTPSLSKCTASFREDMNLYDGHGHNYGIMLEAWAPHLFWHLALLSRGEGEAAR